MERYTCVEMYSNGEAVESDLVFEHFVLDEIARVISQLIINRRHN